jgi:5-methylcytosine-specific restriction endonuclease McrA
MAETSTPTYPCTGCGVRIARRATTGRPPSKCDACKAIKYVAKKLRDAAALSAKTPPIVRDLSCTACGIGFTRPGKSGPKPSRCPACSAAHATASRAAYSTRLSKSLASERAARFERDGRWSICERCERRVACSRTGKLRQRCSSCARLRRKEVLAQWKADNPDAWQTISLRYTQKRRALLAEVEHEDFDSSEIFERDKWHCGICGKRIDRSRKFPDPRSPSLDHVVPLSEGGAHTRANSRAAHFGCNSGRCNRGGNEQLALIG